MNLLIKLLFILFILLPFLASANTPPQVNAGADQVVVYPTSNSTKLSGSGSDAEGPVTFLWQQIGDARHAKIAHSKVAATRIGNLKPGIYTFSLTVTDSNGVSQTDTVNVSVFQKLTWVVEGVAREALVHPPLGGKTTAAPVIIAFHAHDDTDSAYALEGFELSWPEAIVVYPQGIRTKGKILDLNCRRAGWQTIVGEVNCANGIVNQDLKFFDSILTTLKKRYNVNPNLVFAQGWSNGAAFIYNALWPTHRQKLAALGVTGGDLDSIGRKKSIPVIHAAGKEDQSDPFESQWLDVKDIRNLNQCTPNGVVWASNSDGLLAKNYGSPIGDPVVFLKYEGGHSFPPTVPPLMVKFFKEIADSITAATPLITTISPSVNKSLSTKQFPQNTTLVNVAVPRKPDE